MAHHWNRVRCAAGLGDVDLYLATRHYFGWYAMNVLGLPAHVIALQFGIRTAASSCAPATGTPMRRSPATRFVRHLGRCLSYRPRYARRAEKRTYDLQRFV